MLLFKKSFSYVYMLLKTQLKFICKKMLYNFVLILKQIKQKFFSISKL